MKPRNHTVPAMRQRSGAGRHADTRRMSDAEIIREWMEHDPFTRASAELIRNAAAANKRMVQQTAEESPL